MILQYDDIHIYFGMYCKISGKFEMLANTLFFFNSQLIFDAVNLPIPDSSSTFFAVVFRSSSVYFLYHPFPEEVDVSQNHERERVHSNIKFHFQAVIYSSEINVH